MIFPGPCPGGRKEGDFLKHMWIPAAVFALLAGIAVYFSLRLASARTTEPVAAQNGGTVTVVVAAQAIPAHTAIAGDMVRLEKLPASAAMSDAARSLTQVIGRVSDVSFVAGEQILQQRLVPISSAGAASRLDAVVSKNMRAFELAVDTTEGVNGMIVPGDHVDLVVTLNKGNVISSELLLQNILVLAAGSNLSANSAANYSAVTLSLTPDQAVLINNIAASCKIQLILRAPGDSTVVSVPARLTAK